MERNRENSSKKKKITPRKRKIYNNTFRLKQKGYKVIPSKMTIYHTSEEVLKIKQARNLIELGFVLQLEII